MARIPQDYSNLPKANLSVSKVSVSACNISTPAPAASAYWRNFLENNPAYMTITIICIVATLFIVVLYCIKFYYIRVYVSSYRRASKMAWVAAIFPVTACVSIVGICMPRTLQIVDIFIYLYFTRCLFTFVQLIADYFGGEIEMAKFLHDDPIQLNTLPCCCCCTCLPRRKPTRALLRRIGILVYQVAILPPLIFFVTAVIWVDQLAGVTRSKFIAVIFPLLSVMQVVSILLASYGTQIFTRMAAVSLHDYCIKSQMRFVQIMVLLYNIQGNIFNICSSTLRVIPCYPTLTSSDVGGLWNHYLLIFEILLLALLAAWCLRPKVNATFDLHHSQLETHAAHRKIAFYEEDFYIHDDELADNVTANAARNRKIKLSDALLETDVLKRQSLNPFAPRLSYSLYGPGPQPTFSYPSDIVIQPSSISNGLPTIAVIPSTDKRSSVPTVARLVSISSSKGPDNRRQGRMVSTSSSMASGEGRRKLSLLDVHHLPRQVSQGPWLQRMPSTTSSNSEDPNRNIRQQIVSISEEVEDEVFHPGDQTEKPQEFENQGVQENLPVEQTTKEGTGQAPQVSVTEYLI